MRNEGAVNGGHGGLNGGADYSPDFDFRHHLRDTILLLGGSQKIADLLLKSQDGKISEADIAGLRNYNISLFTGVKGRLKALNKLRLQAAD